MKRLLTLTLALFITGMAFSQFPFRINYQGVARNSSGQALANQSIKVRLTVLSGTTTAVSETWAVSTNALGLFNIVLGSGGAISQSGDVSEVYWDQLITPQLKVELDINNNGVFTVMGTQELATVPYSFYSANAMGVKNLGGLPVRQDIPAAVGNVLTWNGTQWTAGTSNKPRFLNLFSSAGTFAANSTNWVLAGAAPSFVDVVAGETITGSFSVALGTSAGTTTNNVGVSVCYQKFDNAGNPIGPITSFNPTTFLEVSVGPNRQIYSANSMITVTSTGTSGTITPGKYRFFLGIRNSTTLILSNTDQVNGFVTIQ